MCCIKSQTVCMLHDTWAREKSKGVTLSALCKVLNFPRWVYFSTGRAGFRSRRDVRGDGAANRANTHTQRHAHTHMWCATMHKKHKCTPTHTTNTNTVSGLCKDWLVGALVFSAFSLPLAGSLSSPTHYTVPEEQRIMHKTKHVGRNN